MNGYIESGYVVALVSIGGYAATLLRRERSVLRRTNSLPSAHPAKVESTGSDTLAISTETDGN